MTPRVKIVSDNSRRWRRATIALAAIFVAGCGTPLDVLPDRALQSACVIIADWNPNTTPGQARTSAMTNTTTFAQFEQDSQQIKQLAPDIRDARIRGTMLALASKAETFGTRVQGAIGEDFRFQSSTYESERRVRNDMRDAVIAARRHC